MIVSMILMIVGFLSGYVLGRMSLWAKLVASHPVPMKISMKGLRKL